MDVQSATKPKKQANTSAPQQAAGASAQSLLQFFLNVRQYSQHLCAALQDEDLGLQAMPETSPLKWHLAHSTWFFETFILKAKFAQYQVFHPAFEQLFNSYYNGISQAYPRAQRHLLSRPTIEEVFAYRAHVDNAISALINSGALEFELIAPLLELGCHHEQQHQELMLTDLKYCWHQNPMLPSYYHAHYQSAPRTPLQFEPFEGGLVEIGHRGASFCFDNEQPRHKHYLEPFKLASRLVSNAEYLAFIEAGGYELAELWLADGWALSNKPKHPLYWQKREGQWYEYTLHGLQPLNMHAPLGHVSAYEADAYARWCNMRLPSEFEWEYAQRQKPNKALINKRWQWTSSAYAPYPAYKAANGAIGEYNGKFMANQLVLKGGSAFSSAGHYRPSYRNFFYPKDQWQLTGICLAQD